MRGANHYWLVGNDDEGRHGIAEGGEVLAASLAVRLGPQSWLTDWEAPRVELTEGEPVDYLETDLPLRLCSMRLRGLIDVYRAFSDRWQWLPVTVFRGPETWDYMALHVLQSPNWLDPGHSRYVDGELVKVAVSREFADNRRVLAPRQDLRTWLVDDELCEEIEEARTSGMAFFEVETI
jgi:hypothetical protein